MGRSYGQYDPLAWALDLVGERWTLLILRDVLLGPRRFTELLERSPGLSRTLLSARLRKLETQGLIARVPARAPRAQHAYAATADAWSLAIAFAPLGIWGAHRMTGRRAGDVFRASSFALGMAVFADRDAARGVRETYQFEVESERFYLRVGDDEIRPREGTAPDPDLIIRTDAEACVRIMRGAAPADLVLEGRMTAEGSPDAAANCLAIFRPPPEASVFGLP